MSKPPDLLPPTCPCNDPEREHKVTEHIAKAKPHTGPLRFPVETRATDRDYLTEKHADRPARAYLDPLHDELDRLRTELAKWDHNGGRVGCNHEGGICSRFDGYKARAEQAEARVEALAQELATVRDTLRHRSNALNATGTHNDQLRAQLARVKKLADSAGDLDNGILVWDLRAALADKEPTP